jgi:methyltransferase
MYYLLILAVGIERLIELFVAKRNARWAFSQGGKEFGHNHYPVMVTLHTALLLGCVIEVWGLRRRWNTLVIVVPNAPLVRRGPYRFLHHPNYVAVVAEGLALPLVHTAWLTAIGFTLANWLLLTVRIRVENAALGYTHDAPDDAPAKR